MASDNTEHRAIQIIQNEITTLITSMRKVSTSRWGTTSTIRSIDEEPDEFLKSLYSLRSTVTSLSTLYSLDCSALLDPFIGIIRDEAISGYITGLALLSLNKFIICEIISVNSKGTNLLLVADIGVLRVVFCRNNGGPGHFGTRNNTHAISGKRAIER